MVVPAITVNDFVSYEECRRTAQEYLDQNHPGLAQCLLGPELVEFALALAANTAYQCASEATRRAKGLSCA